jgi:hypothetical protein
MKGGQIVVGQNMAIRRIDRVELLTNWSMETRKGRARCQERSQSLPAQM